MLRPKWQQWFFGKTGGLISPEVESPWGYILLGIVLGVLARALFLAIGRIL